MSYEVVVSYEDQQGHSFGPERHILDFRIFEGQAQGPKGMPELIKAVEKMQRQHERWSAFGGGLAVRSRDEDKYVRRDHRPIHIAKALRAKDEHGWRGLLDYVVGHLRRQHGLYEREGWRKRGR